MLWCMDSNCGTVAQKLWDLSSLMRIKPASSSIGRWILNHWTPRELLRMPLLKCHFPFPGHEPGEFLRGCTNASFTAKPPIARVKPSHVFAPSKPRTFPYQSSWNSVIYWVA